MQNSAGLPGRSRGLERGNTMSGVNLAALVTAARILRGPETDRAECAECGDTFERDGVTVLPSCVPGLILYLCLPCSILVRRQRAARLRMQTRDASGRDA